MSPSARPERSALDELERLLGLVEEELTTWRARCLRAEQELGHKVGKALPTPPELQQYRHKVGLLEGENQLLRQRIGAAREQVEQLRTRLRFVEEHGAEGAA
jgi:chromosome segregation ATPase